MVNPFENINNDVIKNNNVYCVFYAHTPSRLDGNPAAVIEISRSPYFDYQQVAQDLNLPVTVFYSLENQKQNPNSNTPKILFFYPNKETNLCVHGALALACHLLKNSENNKITIQTNKNHEYLLSKIDDQYFIDLPPVVPVSVQINKKKICAMLNLDQKHLDDNLPFEVSTQGSPKLLIPINELHILNRLKPDFDAIADWSFKNNVNGFYVYTSETMRGYPDFHARNFNPLSGQNEDIATGIAAAALCRALKNASFGSTESKLKQSYIIEQGFCLIYVKILEDVLQVGGNVDRMPIS